MVAQLSWQTDASPHIMQATFCMATLHQEMSCCPWLMTGRKGSLPRCDAPTPVLLRHWFHAGMGTVCFACIHFVEPLASWTHYAADAASFSGLQVSDFGLSRFVEFSTVVHTQVSLPCFLCAAAYITSSPSLP